MAARLRYKVDVMSSFDPRSLLANVQKHEVTALQASPLLLVMLQKRSEVEDYDLSSLKHIFFGTAPASAELQRNVSKRFKLKIDQGYGMSEVTAGAIVTPFEEATDQSGTIDILTQNTEVKLVSDAGTLISEECKWGEFFIRGPQVMIGYWNNEAANEEVFDSEGFYCTGDIGYWKRDHIGRERFFLIDRKKELINISKNCLVAPSELVAVLIQSPYVADAAVVGLKLEEDGRELPRAYVLLEGIAKEEGMIKQGDIRKFVQGRVEKFKRLEGGVKFVDKVPRLPSGKIERKAVRDFAKQDAEDSKSLKVQGEH